MRKYQQIDKNSRVWNNIVLHNIYASHLKIRILIKNILQEMGAANPGFSKSLFSNLKSAVLSETYLLLPCT